MDAIIKNIYLDNQSTTFVDQRVLHAMMPYLTNSYGNPSSDNLMARNAKAAILRSRNQISGLINASSDEIYFTSGATESINWALRGIVEKAPITKRHIITSSIEHSAVLNTCNFLSGYYDIEVTIVKPDENGIIDLNTIIDAIKPETLIIAIQHANNEIGTIQPIKQIGEICRKRDIVFMVDAAQSIGKIQCDVIDMNIDILAASGHKIHAPKGIGFIYINKSAKVMMNPLLYGGGQEDGFRSGTQNVPYIVALGEACKICSDDMEVDSIRIMQMKNRFVEILTTNVKNLEINGSMENRLPGNINFSVNGTLSRIIIKNLQYINISKGSACNANTNSKSHVLMSITDDESRINSALRVGIGKFNTMDEIEYAAQEISKVINQLLLINEQY